MSAPALHGVAMLAAGVPVCVYFATKPVDGRLPAPRTAAAVFAFVYGVLWIPLAVAIWALEAAQVQP